MFFILVFYLKASAYGDNVRIEAEHENIMHPKFDMFFFKSFDVVINALDNVKARQYVNTMCVLAGVPLVEGGSTGLLGQSYPIIPHYTECYNCKPRGGNEGEQYAVCTIRSTPDKLEHCIVWAKELFVLLFGKRDDSLLYEEVDSAYMDSLTPANDQVLSEPSKCLEFCIDLLEALFDREIEKRIQIGSYTTIHKPPSPVQIRHWIVLSPSILVRTRIEKEFETSITSNKVETSNPFGMYRIPLTSLLPGFGGTFRMQIRHLSDRLIKIIAGMSRLSQQLRIYPF